MLGFSYGLPMLPLVGSTLALALSLWMMDVLLGSAERKQRKFVQGAFSRYVSPAVVNQLVENPDSLRISGERRELSFIFTDIQGFTTLSEKLSSEKLAEVLKRMAGDRGYQTLINETLKSSVNQADMANTLRQIVRKEMRGKRKTAKKQRAEALLPRSPEGRIRACSAWSHFRQVLTFPSQ